MSDDKWREEVRGPFELVSMRVGSETEMSGVEP